MQQSPLLRLLACLLILSAPLLAQEQVRMHSLQDGDASRIPSSLLATGDTIALWYMNEPAGSFIADSSGNGHHGTAWGTTVVPGTKGNARFFNGFGDYVYVPNSPTGAFDFGPGQSFTISAWFKTTQTGLGHILRRGLAPLPGYDLRIHQGRVEAEIGNREDGSPPDTVLRITSRQLYNDGAWHHAMVVRDQERRKLYLYVDGEEATTPLVDPIPFPLSSVRPITIGRWENTTLPTYFQGVIDEVYIFRGARHPAGFFLPRIAVSPPHMNFGRVLVGSTSSQNITVSNLGGGDTLRVSGITSTNPLFSVSVESLRVPAGELRTVTVQYTPTATQVDTGSLFLPSNDPAQPLVGVTLSAEGLVLGSAPVIRTIRDIPNDQGKQVRVIWYRSIHDRPEDTLRVIEYHLWRRVDDSDAPEVPGSSPPVFIENSLWDYVGRVPAVQFDQYAFVAPTLFDSTITAGLRWSIFRVSAHTITGTFFFSEPDSGYSIDNLPPYQPMNLVASLAGNYVALGWSEPVDPDFSRFVIHRGTSPNFIPSPATLIGTTRLNLFNDHGIVGHPVLYYRIAALDSSGNQSPYSDEAGVTLTDIGGDETGPVRFQLGQNYPNPFNPSTTIWYDIPENARVTITVYDILGRVAAILVDDIRERGRFDVLWDGKNAAAGVYFYRMTAGGFTQTRSMMLLR